MIKFGASPADVAPLERRMFFSPGAIQSISRRGSKTEVWAKKSNNFLQKQPDFQHLHASHSMPWPAHFPYAKPDVEDVQRGLSLCDESSTGDTEAKGNWTILADDRWHDYTWTVSDANFATEWGWNFRFDGIGSPNEFLNTP
jgi:hypothetical protein